MKNFLFIFLILFSFLSFSNLVHSIEIVCEVKPDGNISKEYLSKWSNDIECNF